MSAEVYAGFRLPHCGPAWRSSIAAAARRQSRSAWRKPCTPVGSPPSISIRKDSFAAVRCRALSTGRRNLAFTVADARQLPFCDAAFDVVLCHSVIETLGDPAGAAAELLRVTKPGGVVGAASVEYGGISIGGRKTAGPYRYYDIRQRLWRAARSAEPKWKEQTRLSSAAVVAWAVGPRSANHRHPVFRILG